MLVCTSLVSEEGEGETRLSPNQEAKQLAPKCPQGLVSFPGLLNNLNSSSPWVGANPFGGHELEPELSEE